MCKIMSMAGIQPNKEKLMWQFIVKSTPFMTGHDKDGLGFAALGNKGLWGERWLNPGEAWAKDSRQLFTSKDAEQEAKFKGGLEKNIKYNNFGVGGSKQGNKAIIFHSRMATCEKNIDNTHPFVRGNTALIHNGVISNKAELKMLTSTCDSETILNAYHDDGVANDPDKIQDMVKKLQGYYGCAVLTKAEDGNEYLDIFRHTASIYASFVEELGTTVYCTSDDIIKFTCKAMKFNYGHMFKIKEDTMIRIDAKTGMPILHRKFDSTYSWYAAKEYGKVGGSSANMGESQTTETSTTTPSGHKVGQETTEKKTYLAIVPKSKPTTPFSKQQVVEETRASSHQETVNTSLENASDDNKTYADVIGTTH
jgi:predicted glutamine amidotransferase